MLELFIPIFYLLANHGGILVEIFTVLHAERAWLLPVSLNVALALVLSILAITPLLGIY
jgi:hypothetical protein